MICKYYLTLNKSVTDTASADCMDVSAMISNLDDIEVSYLREGLGGVVRKVGSMIDFVGEARERIVALYTERQLYSEASFAVFRMNDDWTYSKFFECPLDFSTFSFDEYVASCGCLDSSAAAVIKAKRSVKYDFPVSDLKEALSLSYDGIRIQNDATFEVIGETIEGDDRRTHVTFDRKVWWWVPRLGMINSNLINNHSLLVSDQEESFQSNGEDNGWGFPNNTNVTSYFAECVADCVVSIDFSSFSIKDSSRSCFVLFKVTNGTAIPLTCGYSNMASLDQNTRIESVKWSGKLFAGDKLQYAVFNHDRTQDMGSTGFYIYPQGGSARWSERSSAVSVDIISPVRLLDRLLKSMSRDDLRIYGGIKSTVENEYTEESNSRLNMSFLAAGDSIRNIPDAKITTSFDEFCKFMEAVYGYVYEIQEKVISGNSIPDYIVSDSYDFAGMSSRSTNITSVDSPSAVIKFSTTEKCFVAIEEDSSLKDCSASFPGCEKYQSYTDGSYKVHTDRYFHDTDEDMYYTASVAQSTTGRNAWEATLSECEVNVVEASYAGTCQFGGVVSSYDTDYGTYSETVDSASIVYVRKKKRFAYEHDGKFYSAFVGDTEYNLSDRARTDMLYECHAQKYVILGTSLTKCMLVEGDAETAPLVMFRHRDELFANKESHKIERVSDFSYSVSRRIYSQIEIGYNKQDYDIGNNGKDEFNFKNSYTTGISLSDSKLSLISPYRADSYGFEELAEKRGEETSSTESDSNIFVIHCAASDNCLVPDRSTPVFGVMTDTVFNAGLSPVSMIKANKRYLASFTNSLTFASTEGSSECAIYGQSVVLDVPLSDPLLGNGDISFVSDDFSASENWNGQRLEIEVSGRTYYGFLQSLDMSADETDVLKYKLIESR